MRFLSALHFSRLAHTMADRPMAVAVLFQALQAPSYGGVSKPQKPGGYQDSGADIAFTLRRNNINTITPVSCADPAQQDQWCFPDTEEGILSVIHQGATHLWANCVVFASHPLQASGRLSAYLSQVKVVSQAPLCVDICDDKAFLSAELRKRRVFTLPRSWTFHRTQNLDAAIAALAPALQTGSHEHAHAADYPFVAKPVRGRGSHGVKLCRSPAELAAHLTTLFRESAVVMVEEFLRGEEATVTVMPPLQSSGVLSEAAVRNAGLNANTVARHWALPPVKRFNHVDGIAPYSGIVAVTANSCVVTESELKTDPTLSEIMRECEAVASLLGVTAPIRIDIRRVKEGGKFALFDVNLKPNMTGPGRPERDDQASLSAMAAEAIGWDYPTLLRYILDTAVPLEKLREYQNPFN